MKIRKKDLLEAKFVVPMEKVKDFEEDMEPELEPEDTVHVMDENKFVVPDEDVKDFDKNMGDNLEKDDIVQVVDSDNTKQSVTSITKEGLIRTIKESLRNKKKLS